MGPVVFTGSRGTAVCKFLTDWGILGGAGSNTISGLANIFFPLKLVHRATHGKAFLTRRLQGLDQALNQIHHCPDRQSTEKKEGSLTGVCSTRWLPRPSLPVCDSLRAVSLCCESQQGTVPGPRRASSVWMTLFKGWFWYQWSVSSKSIKTFPIFNIRNVIPEEIIQKNNM